MLTIEQLIEKSQWLRKELFQMVMSKDKGHIPSSYSCVEVLVSLFYRGKFKFNAKNPHDPKRDRFFMSKGHASPAIYPILADLGFFEKKELDQYTTPGGLLRMYADPSIPGIESITGSLGHGLGIAAGHALVSKQENLNFKCFVIIGDGECYEGSVWETAMFASHYKLDNLIVIVDRNRLCILDETENCIKLDSLEEKWKAFGCIVKEIDAHSYREVNSAFDQASENFSGKPFVIIANSVKGKGISFMENKAEWHNRMPTNDQRKQAMKELEINPIKG